MFERTCKGSLPYAKGSPLQRERLLSGEELVREETYDGGIAALDRGHNQTVQ